LDERGVERKLGKVVQPCTLTDL